MKLRYFKLVPVEDVKDIAPGQPHVIVTSEFTTSLSQLSPNWARHIAEGSAGVFNMDTLIRENSQH